jgi:uncharacterized membrane protein
MLATMLKSERTAQVKKTNAEILLSEIALWRQEQRIDAATAERLAQRYQQASSLLTVFLRWLGLGSVLLLAGALFSMIGLSMHSKFVSAFLVAAAAVALLYLGVRMTRDPKSPYPVTGAALTTLGLVAVFGAVILFGATDTPDERMPIQLGLLLTAVTSLGIAYRYALRWPLLLGLLSIFHGLGSGSAYAGSGDYVADIANPPLMAVIAFVVAVFGALHLRAEDGRLARYSGFGRLYLILGLLYGNASLWSQSIEGFADNQARWPVLFAIACVVEIVLGARLKDGRLSGFGIVFVSICLYTCFFETAWNKLGSGLFLFLGGLLGLLLGLAFEWWGRRENSTAWAVTP